MLLSPVLPFTVLALAVRPFMSWLSLRFYKAVYTSASFILLLLYIGSFMWLMVKTEALFSGSNGCSLPFPSFCFCTAFHRKRVSALPKREWSMTSSGDWLLRITKLEGTAYDWSHCLVAPMQIATVAIWRPVSIETSHWFLAPDYRLLLAQNSPLSRL